MQRTVLKKVNRLFEMAAEEGFINKNPAKGIRVKVPSVKLKVLTTKEVQKLLADGKKQGHPYYELWVFTLFTGMRCGELYALQLSDVDLDAGIIYVHDHLHLKTGFMKQKEIRAEWFLLLKSFVRSYRH